MPARLSAVERIRAQIDQLFASQQDLGQVLEEVARLSVRLVMQAAALVGCQRGGCAQPLGDRGNKGC